MSLENILLPLEVLDEYKDLIESINKDKKIIEVHGLSEVQKSMLIAALAKSTDKSCLVIAENDALAKKMYDFISFFDMNGSVFFPSLEFGFHRIDAKSNDDKISRMKILSRLKDKKRLNIFTSIDALLYKMLDPKHFFSYFRDLILGDNISMDKFSQYFTDTGYERVDMIEGKGQYSIRGGIIDFYSLNEDFPVRIELFGDEIDSIRYFDLYTQRSLDKLDRIQLSPRKEFVLSREDFKNASISLKNALEKTIQSVARKKHVSNMEHILQDNFSEDIEKLEQALYFEGIERYNPYFQNDYYSFIDYLEDFFIVIDEPNRVRQKCDMEKAEFIEHFKDLQEKGEVLAEQSIIQFDYDDLLQKLKKEKLYCFNTFLKTSIDFKPQEIIGFKARDMMTFHGKIDLLIEEIKQLKDRRYRILIVSGSQERGKRLKKELYDLGVESIYQDELTDEVKEGQIVIIPGTLKIGLEFPQIKYAIITDTEVLGVGKKKARKKKTRKDKSVSVKFFSDLKLKDYVVHEHHGVGQYMGIERLKVNEIERDYLNIRYRGNDKLYIPTDQLDMIQKYVGGEGAPRLNKLSSVEWARTKDRARRAIEDMALDLIKLYAERQKLKGFAFSEDTQWQKEFEDLFSYHETPDQLKCIDEIKEDMQNTKVMDRLLCGDVGYGKTEVALRAAFKAIMDGKQVAILVPTTILAQQHYTTCLERFKNFPVNIEMLSRFNSSAEQKKIIGNIKRGLVDLVIGTHRLIQKDVEFKNLGFLVVDEEQRFGVAHKERIKQMKKNVDVLTLTATPIPRTLHMSLIGVRDISLIEEPPDERYPVQTYVMEFNRDMIRGSILRELNRGGQVYFLYNRVKTIEKVTRELKSLVPEARISAAHGQMDERLLETTMQEFYDGDIDILVCTTIIESGLDISNVNTIIVFDADKLGLSQLYQLRGRVGRSNRLAYAYLTYQRDKVLTDVAEKRLQAIKEFTEFGSGFKIAMRDLEIRGAGNLLGREQHGHMEAIGYDLYTKLLDTAVGELTGRYKEEKTETSIEIDICAYIPSLYIEDDKQKIEIYKKIASIDSKEYLYDLEEEIEDRFGDIPETVRSLLCISYIKHLGSAAGIVLIRQKDKSFILNFKKGSCVEPEIVLSIMNEYGKSLTFTASEEPFFVLKMNKIEENKYLESLVAFLEKMFI